MSKDDCIIMEERFDDPEQNAAREFVLEQMEKGNNVQIFPAILIYSKKRFRTVKVGYYLCLLISDAIRLAGEPFYPDVPKYQRWCKISNGAIKEFHKSLVKDDVFSITHTEEGLQFKINLKKVLDILRKFEKRISNIGLES